MIGAERSVARVAIPEFRCLPGHHPALTFVFEVLMRLDRSFHLCVIHPVGWSASHARSTVCVIGSAPGDQVKMVERMIASVEVTLVPRREREPGAHVHELPKETAAERGARW